MALPNAIRNSATPIHKKVSELIKKTSITIIAIAIETIYQGLILETKRAKSTIEPFINIKVQKGQYKSSIAVSQSEKKYETK